MTLQDQCQVGDHVDSAPPSPSPSPPHPSTFCTPPLFSRSISAPQIFNHPRQEWPMPSRNDYLFSNQLGQSCDAFQHLAPQPFDQAGPFVDLATAQQPQSFPYQLQLDPHSHSAIHPFDQVHFQQEEQQQQQQQRSIHPFQMDQLASSINNLEASFSSRVKAEFPNETLVQTLGTGLLFAPEESHSMNDCSPRQGSLDDSPSHFHGMARGHSVSFFETCFPPMDSHDEFPAYMFPRHGSLGSLYPITQSHELLDSVSMQTPGYLFERSSPMACTLSSTSISSTSSSSSSSPPPTTAKPRTRRASLSPESSNRVFTCVVEDCTRHFKRSEHLKRHVRSVHTLDKPFSCPIPACPKRFSRSDNLNQHIRIHRHDKEKAFPKPFTNFTPFLAPPSGRAGDFASKRH